MTSVGQAFDSINWVEVGWSALEGANPWKVPGGRVGEAALTGAGAVVTGAVTAYAQGKDYSIEQGLMDFGAAFVADLAGGGVAELASKYGMKAIVKGLGKMGLDDKTIAKVMGLDKLSKNLDGLGTYKSVKGHHVHAKAAFRGHVSYDPDMGLTISNDLMKKMKWDHKLMTKEQQRLFKELRKSGKANTLEVQTQIAIQALMAGGATEAEATFLVVKSVENLGLQGATVPTHIPWSKTSTTTTTTTTGSPQ